VADEQASSTPGAAADPPGGDRTGPPGVSVLSVDPPGVTVLLLALAVAGVSFSAPIVVAVTVPALAVAFWRNAFGAIASAPYVAWRRRAEWLELMRGDARRRWTALGAGVALAVHFGFWIPSLRLTSVAASTALVATTPVWIVALRRVLGERVPRGVVAGVVIAMAGMLLVTGVDAGRSGRALAGDLLALLGGICAAVYVSLGESVRRSVSTASYTLTAYATCALVLLLACLVSGQRIAGAGYGPRTWGLLLVLTACAQLLGHTLFNRALAAAGATTVSLAILLEVPGAALVAWVWLGQRPPVLILPGAALVLAGIALVLLSRRDGGAVALPD
jgi:drug/metabolite transporter (DMT)-like permease